MPSDKGTKANNNSNEQNIGTMDPCSLPTGSTNTSLAHAVSARVAAHRANHRGRATERSSVSSLSSSESPSSMSEGTSPDQQQQRSQTGSPRFLDGELLQGPSSIPLTEMLRTMQLPLYRGGHHRPAPPIRRLLTNEDIIATIDEVLELVGEDALPPPPSSSVSIRSDLGDQPELDR